LWANLDDVVRRLAGGQSDPEPLLPDVWSNALAERFRTYREQESLARATKTNARRARRIERLQMVRRICQTSDFARIVRASTSLFHWEPA